MKQTWTLHVWKWIPSSKYENSTRMMTLLLFHACQRTDIFYHCYQCQLLALTFQWQLLASFNPIWIWTDQPIVVAALRSWLLFFGGRNKQGFSITTDLIPHIVARRNSTEMIYAPIPAGTNPTFCDRTTSEAGSSPGWTWAILGEARTQSTLISTIPNYTFK
jgi:hypothetical protein